MKNLFTQLLVMAILSSPAIAADNRESANAELVKNFYNMVFVDHRTAEAAEKYLKPSYIQHNPNVATGRKAFVDFFVPFFEKNPAARANVKRVIASGDFVMLHVHSKMTATDRGRAIVDIFRVEDNRIVEHWDVIQTIPETSANENGMF